MGMGGSCLRMVVTMMEITFETRYVISMIGSWMSFNSRAKSP
jgi:hypothetical protein